MIIIVIISYIIIIFLDFIPIYKNNNKREIAVYSILLLFALVISILLSLKVKIPSPSEPIEKAVNFIYGKDR